MKLREYLGQIVHHLPLLGGQMGEPMQHKVGDTLEQSNRIFFGDIFIRDLNIDFD